MSCWVLQSVVEPSLPEVVSKGIAGSRREIKRGSTIIRIVEAGDGIALAGANGGHERWGARSIATLEGVRTRVVPVESVALMKSRPTDSSHIQYYHEDIESGHSDGGGGSFENFLKAADGRCDAQSAADCSFEDEALSDVLVNIHDGSEPGGDVPRAARKCISDFGVESGVGTSPTSTDAGWRDTMSYETRECGREPSITDIDDQPIAVFQADHQGRVQEGTESPGSTVSHLQLDQDVLERLLKLAEATKVWRRSLCMNEGVERKGISQFNHSKPVVS